MADKITGYKEVRVKISKFLYSRLKSCAKKRGMTMTNVIKIATINFINEYNKSNDL